MQRLIIAALLLVVSTGCSNFRSKERLDLAPFAENTISLASDIEYGLTETNRLVHLRELWKDPAVAAHRAEWEKVRVLMKGVVAYSVEVTTLGNSTLKGPERAGALAEFLDPLARPVLDPKRAMARARIRISMAGMDSILADIREQKNLLDALQAAQPVIDEVARISDEVFDEVGESLDTTAKALMDKIDESNAQAVYYEHLVKQIKYSVFRRIVFLGQYRTTGEKAALDSLFTLDPQLTELVANPNKPTVKEMSAIEARLYDKATALETFAKQIQPDIDLYHAQQRELADLYTAASHQLRRARTTMIVWARAHRNLAQGITDPAKVNLFNITKKAIKTAL